MPQFTFEDTSVEAATIKAEQELGVKREMLDIEVMEEKDKGLLGLKWGKSCVIKVTTRGSQSEAFESNTDDGEVVKKAVAELDKLMELSGFKGKISSNVEDDEIKLDVSLDPDLESLFIGKRGKNIDSYQYLLNKIVENSLKERVKRIVIDCAEYRVRRRESLRSMAKKAAREMKEGCNTYTFPPMQAGDRRIIHMTMKEEGFNTESSGRGEEKKVVATSSQSI